MTDNTLTLKTTTTAKVTFRADHDRTVASSNRRKNRHAVECFVFPEGETILEGLTGRHNRPQDEYATHARRAFAAMGITPETMKWDTKCGCAMCPCSPGFIVTLTAEDEERLRKASGIAHNGVNVFITVSTEADA